MGAEIGGEKNAWKTENGNQNGGGCRAAPTDGAKTATATAENSTNCTFFMPCF